MSQEQITQETVPVAETTQPTTEAPKEQISLQLNNLLLLSHGRKQFQKSLEMIQTYLSY